MNFIVYKTTNIINSKIYIGVHYTNPDVFDGYIGCGVSKGNLKKSVVRGFPAAVRKYGYKNFVRETLYVYPDSEEGMKQAYEMEASIVTWEFVKRNDNYNLTIGGNHPPYELLRKQIAQYTLDGKFICKWDSITDAQNCLNLTSISRAISGESAYCGEFQWKFYINEDDIPPVIKYKTVYQFDLQGNLIKVFKNCAEAAKQFIKHESARVMINRCCIAPEQQKQAYGYFWSHKCKFAYTPQNFESETAVAKYDDSGKFIESYSSIREAAELNNLKNYYNIVQCIKGKQKHCKGFRWRFFYGNTNNIKPLK